MTDPAHEPPAVNPYEAPRALDWEPPPTPGDTRPVIATRGRRLAGAMIDGALTTMPAGIVAYILAGQGLDPFPRPPTPGVSFAVPSSLLTQLCILVPTLLQWYLVATRGQSIGKILVRTKIMLADGRVAGLHNGVILRAVPLFLLALVPAMVEAFTTNPIVLGSFSPLIGLVFLVDELMIFGNDYRCLHDLVAGTFVISVPRPEAQAI